MISRTTVWYLFVSCNLAFSLDPTYLIHQSGSNVTLSHFRAKGKFSILIISFWCGHAHQWLNHNLCHRNQREKVIATLKILICHAIAFISHCHTSDLDRYSSFNYSNIIVYILNNLIEFIKWLMFTLYNVYHTVSRHQADRPPDYQTDYPSRPSTKLTIQTDHMLDYKQ